MVYVLLLWFGQDQSAVPVIIGEYASEQRCIDVANGTKVWPGPRGKVLSDAFYFACIPKS